jgi:hypothetical protein
VQIWINRQHAIQGEMITEKEARIRLQDGRTIDVGIAPTGALGNTSASRIPDKLQEWIEIYLGLGEVQLRMQDCENVRLDPR